MHLLDLLWVAALAVGSGFAGVVVSEFMTRRRGKREISLQIVKDIFGRYRDIAKAKGILQDPNAKARLRNPADLNAIIEVGDWCDVVAHLYAARLADRKLFEKLGIPDMLRSLRDLIDPVAPCSQDLDQAYKSWTHLRQVQ